MYGWVKGSEVTKNSRARSAANANDTFRAQFGHLNVGGFCTQFSYLMTSPHSRVYVLKWKTLSCQNHPFFSSLSIQRPNNTSCQNIHPLIKINSSHKVLFCCCAYVPKCLSAGVFVSFPSIIFSRCPGAAKHKLKEMHRAERKPARPVDSKPVILFSGHCQRF